MISKERQKAILLIIAAAALFWFSFWYWRLAPNGSLRLASDYQAVFLTEGAVYFGKLSHENSRYAILRDVYYLQVANQATSTQGLNLVKLGAEVYGPMDEMRINRNHIVLIEDLRTDSQVVQGIKRFKEGNR